jgi:hypothetical protein
LVTCCERPVTANEFNRFKWVYRQSAFGVREQKRLYYSPYGDSVCSEVPESPVYNSHQWTYYLLGAGGEQLAVYKGEQVAYPDSCEEGGTQRRVYMYASSYITAGGLLSVLPDSTKLFNIIDNIGSVRTTIKFIKL